MAPSETYLIGRGFGNGAMAFEFQTRWGRGEEQPVPAEPTEGGSSEDYIRSSD